MQREKKRQEIYQRLRTKSAVFCRKYKDAHRWLHEEGDVPTLKEELKKKDEELLASIEQFNLREGAFRRKEEELKLSKGVEAQCSNLYSQVD